MDNKHKHADMIIAKANNMDLIVFVKLNDHSSWGKATDQSNLAFVSDYRYFLCLPQHEEACLYWLNGGGVQGRSEGGWVNYSDSENVDWNANTSFIDADFEIRIKPRKEKRWIAINRHFKIVSTEAYTSHDETFNEVFGGCLGNMSGCQIVPVEIEVTNG